MRGIDENYCRQETLTALESILTNDEEQRLGSIVTRMVVEALVPWHKRNDIMTKSELVESIREYVYHAMKPYNGSANGFLSFRQEKWLVFALLFGMGTADSLVDYDTDEDMVVNYKVGTWSLEIPGMKRSAGGQYYNEEMLRWCKEMAPNALSDMSEGQLVEIMLPIWRMYKPELYGCGEMIADEYASLKEKIRTAVMMRIREMRGKGQTSR